MIAFASLFLGLILGTKPVELVVGDGVAAVELRLDGESLGTLHRDPWLMECDFGSDLAPRHLEAIAYDAAEREVGRVSQWLNLPQPKVATSVVLEPRQPGEPRIARLSWESTLGAEPEAVTATLDGQPITVDDPRRIVMPPTDDEQFHLLHIELRFEGRVESRVDLTFGGAYVDEVSTEITALPIWATRKVKQAPSVAEAQGWFSKAGESLRVIAIEKESAEVVVVMDRPFPHLLEPGAPNKVPKALELSKGLGVRFLSTLPEEREGVASTFDLFPLSPAYDRDQGDLYWMLTRLMRPSQDRQPRPTAAVAVAGLAAYEGRRRRAVVLIPSARPVAEDNKLDPAIVRRYLAYLHVPLVVWNPENRSSLSLDVWGGAKNTGSLKGLAAAFAELAGNLDQQWIVWLDGRHLPQSITLAPRVKDFTLTMP